MAWQAGGTSLLPANEPATGSNKERLQRPNRYCNLSHDQVCNSVFFLSGMTGNLLSELVAVAQVAGVAKARNDVFVFVHAGIYRCTPNCGSIFREHALDVVYSLGIGYHAGHMDASGSSLGEECFIAQFHRASRCQHGVGYDEGFGVDTRCCQVFHMHAHVVMFGIGVFAISRYKGIAGMVEDVEEAVVERQAGTEYRSQHNLVYGHIHTGNAQGSGYILGLISQGFGYLIGFHLADALDIVAKKQSVFLIIDIAHLRQVLINNGIGVAEINDLHGLVVRFYVILLCSL